MMRVERHSLRLSPQMPDQNEMNSLQDFALPPAHVTTASVNSYFLNAETVNPFVSAPSPNSIPLDLVEELEIPVFARFG